MHNLKTSITKHVHANMYNYNTHIHSKANDHVIKLTYVHTYVHTVHMRTDLKKFVKF